MAIGTDVIGQGNASTTQGTRKLVNIAAARKVPQYIEIEIDISENVCPLVRLIEKYGKHKTVSQEAYFWLQEDKNPIAVSTSTSYSSSATTIVLTTLHGARVRIGDLLKVLRTGELLRVTDRSSDTITVATRGTWSSTATTAAAINSGEEIQILADAQVENSSAPAGISTEPNILTNYMQTMRYSVDASGRDINSENYGKDKEFQRITRQAVMAMRMKKEAHFMFCNTVNSADPTVTGGLEYGIQTNITNVNGSMSESQLDTNVTTWMRRNYNQSNLLVVCGEKFVATLDSWGRDNLRFTPDDHTLGFETTTWQSSFGRLKIMRHGLLSPLGSGVPYSDNIGSAGAYTNNGSGGWEGYAFFLNLALTGDVSWTGRSMKFEANTQTPGVDGKKDTWTDDVGFWMGNEKAFAKMYGISGT